MKLLRGNFVEQLVPEPGWKLDALLGTTFGLDIQTLFALFLGLIGGELETASGSARPTNQLAMLDALIPLAQRVRIVADRCQIQAPLDINPRLLLLIDRVIGDVHIENGCFHPKIWVARYTRRGHHAKPPPARLRILVTSRNLTRTPTWELFTAIDAVEESTPPARPGLCQDAASLIEMLPSKIKDDPSVERIRNGLRTARPVLGDAFETARLRVQWPGQQPPLSKYLPKRGAHLLVVSPFLKEGFFEHVQSVKNPSRFKRVTVISCHEALDAPEIRAPKRLSKSGQDVWAMRTGLHGGAQEPGEMPDRDTDETHDAVELALHAKLMICEGAKSVTFLGSANATNAGWFGRNVETMLEFRPGFPIRSFVDQFVYQEREAEVLQPWIERWEPNLTPNDPDPQEAEAIARLDRAIAFVAGLDIHGEYEDDELLLSVGGADSDACQTLKQDLGQLTIEWALASQPKSKRPLAQLLDGFREPLSLIDVTNLLVVHIVMRNKLADDRTLSRRRIFQFDLTMSDTRRDERDRAIYRDLLSTADFNRLLAGLLAGLPAQSRPSGVPKVGGNSTPKSVVFFGVSLERLLRKCTEDPSVIDEIQHLLAIFEDAPDPIDPVFLSVWEQVYKALGPKESVQR